MAKIFPSEAKKRAFISGISLANAATNATSELKGTIVAARNAERKSTSSAILYS